MLKKIFKTIVRFLLITLFSAFLLIGVLRNNQVQSLLANVTSTYLSEKLDVKVWIDKVSITSYFHVNLLNVHIFDHNEQPMITAKRIEADMNIFEPYLHEIPINYLILDSAFVMLKQYKGEDELNITKLFSKSDSKEADTVSNSNQAKRSPIQFSIDHLKVKQTHFVYLVEKDSDEEVLGMDYQFIDVSGINIELSDIHLYDDSINANILQLGGKDRCGVEIKDLEGEANVGPRHLLLNNARMLTAQSSTEFDLAFHYDSWSAYLDFIDKVKIDAKIQPSQINLEDIAYFAPTLIGMDNLVRVKGHVKGPVRNLKGRDLKLSYGKSTNFQGHLQMSGLPNIYETFINLKLKDFSTSLVDIQNFKLPDGDQIIYIPEALQKFEKFRVKGRFTGFYNDFVSESDLYTDMGKFTTDIQFMNIKEDSIIKYKGKLNAQNFELGTFIENEEDFGNINFGVLVQGQGLNLEDLNTNVFGQINQMVYKGNELDTIFIDAIIKENKFLGSLKIDDDLIKTDFTGNISFDSIDPYFDFVADFRDVKLSKLGLLPIDSTANLSTRVHMNFIGSQIDSIIGEINIDSINFQYKGESYALDSLHIKSLKSNELNSKKAIVITSDFLNGSVKGDYNLLHFLQDFENYSKKYISNINLTEGDDIRKENQELDIEFTLANTQTITSLFLPSLEISDSAFVKGSWNNSKSHLDLIADFNQLSWNGIIYDRPSISILGNEADIEAKLLLKEIIFMERSAKDSLSYGIDSLNITMQLANDSLDFGINWSNLNRLKNNSGDVSGSLVFADNQEVNLEFDQSNMIINDTLWNIQPGSKFNISNVEYIFDSIQFYSINQSLLLDGNISKLQNNELFIQFKQFNISTFDILLDKYGINLDGFLTGDIQLIDVLSNTNFLADLKIDDLSLNGEKLGKSELKSTWNADQSVFINVSIQKDGNKGVFKPLYLEGFYYPNRNKNQLDVDLSLHNLSIHFLDPFLKSFVSDLEGKSTGNIHIGGTIKEPNLSGKMDLIRTQFRIKYLNTLYSLSGTLNLDNEMLGFNEVTVYDTLGNKALIQGGLTHQNLRKFGVDLKVKPDEFIGLNTRKGMNELFYGSAVVTGEINIVGGFDNIFLDIDAESKKGTDITIPINLTRGVSDNNFIVFVDESDTLKEDMETNYVPELSSFSLNMDLAVTPDAKVEIGLPSQLGSINAQGRGDLNMNLSRTGNFRMSGDYRVSKGLFFFQIGNLLNRRFTLNEGGTISWTGDPYNGTLGMSANYQVKTSLNSLGLEQDSSYRSRVPVDCIIGLSGPIMNPNVKFKFEFPNATEEIKQYVFTKIDTTNPAEMSQQMLSLLVLNSFSFNSATNNGNIANSVGGSSLQIVANQLSNWLSQISKDVDIGINYRPGGDLSNEEVEVALSTQLFDERVTIDGNFGYQNVQNNPSSNTSSIVGDINVEVKITKDGRLRLKAFNRTNTVDLMDNTSPYTQGVGVFYRKEFNSVKDLFKSKKKKEEEQKEELEKELQKAVRNNEEAIEVE